MKNLRDWMLEGDADAGPRLDALRARALAPRALSAADIVIALFRPPGAWVALLLAWLALAAAAHVVNRESGKVHGPMPRLTETDLTLLLTNESPAPLDHHS